MSLRRSMTVGEMKEEDDCNGERGSVSSTPSTDSEEGEREDERERVQTDNNGSLDVR